MVTVVALIVAIAVTGLFTRTHLLRATVMALASIIGSGFLICGPFLAHKLAPPLFPPWPRFSFEALPGAAHFHDPIAWLALATQGVLALA